MAGTGFTKQQLTGGPRYSHALLGNYSEDHTQAELAAKDYELKRSRGQLLSLRQQRQGSIMMQTVSTCSSAALLLPPSHCSL